MSYKAAGKISAIGNGKNATICARSGSVRKAGVDGSVSKHYPLQIKRRLKKSVVIASGVDQHNIARVIHRVVIALRHFTKGHIHLIGKAAQGEKISRDADKFRMKVAHIFRQYLGSIAG